MAEGMNEENRDTDKWAGDKNQYLCNSQRKSRSHFGKNINMNVSFSKQTRQELNTCTAPYDKFLRANHSYKHDDNIYVHQEVVMTIECKEYRHSTKNTHIVIQTGGAISPQGQPQTCDHPTKTFYAILIYFLKAYELQLLAALICASDSSRSCCS